MARSESMASIDAALQQPVILRQGYRSSGSSPAAPHPAPGVDAPTPLTGGDIPSLTADQERYLKAQRQAKTDLENEADAQERARQQAIKDGASDFNAGIRLGETVSKVANTSALTLENVPTPGSIAFPLIILVVFFALLLPINGHTRLTWLWLVMTGNASITNGGGSNQTTAAPTQDTNATVPLSAADTSSIISLPSYIQPYAPGQMTGVEQL